jgi:hypothetical protein
MMIALNRARHRPASIPVMVGVVASVFAAVVVVGILTRDSDPTTAGPGSKAELLAYADGIYPAAEQAGKSIVAGIRPDISDFEAGRISVKVWTIDMQARRRELTEAKRLFDRTPAPSSVKDAPIFFDRAFQNYLEAVRLLLEAGTVEGAQRTALIDRAAETGNVGDDLFDQGAARIQSARRALGLGPDLRFSDKPLR